MLYYIPIPVALFLLLAFVLLTAVEGSRGMRVLGKSRDRLDARVARTSFVLRHVDWGAFFNDVARAGFERALHDVAHTTLLAVRFLERVLTRAVRSLRMRRMGTLPDPAEPVVAKESRIASTARYLKTALKRTRRAPKQPQQLELDKRADDVVEL